MNLIVNGDEYRHEGQGTMAELFRELQAEPGRTAVMVNGEVVRKSRLDSVRLSDGDQVELIMITAGG
jgi:thiamine biosynthesis protein ThiS